MFRSLERTLSPLMQTSRTKVLSLITLPPDMSPKTGDGRRGSALLLGPEDRDELVRWTRGSTTPQRILIRSLIVLLASAGWSDSRIATEIGVTRRTVALWRSRYVTGGRGALLVDAPGRGRKPGRNRDVVERIRMLSHQRPDDGQRWTVRSLARAVGVSHATVHRVCRELHLPLGDAAASAPMKH